jgi:hypothetical protein
MPDSTLETNDWRRVVGRISGKNPERGGHSYNGATSVSWLGDQGSGSRNGSFSEF